MVRGRTIKSRCAAAAAALPVLAGCETAPGTGVFPEARPDDTTLPQVQPTSAESAALRQYFVQVQSAQLSQGLLREDGGGPDTPFTADMLARNFGQIVFYNEYATALRGRGGESPLRRWEGPVRVDVMFGDSLPQSQRSSDGSAVRQYVNRLARATNHPVSQSGRPNFLVVVASEDDRGDALDAAAARIPGITKQSLDPLRQLDRDTYCAVAAYDTGPQSYVYTAAIALIRAENPPLLRLSCIHEELAQGLGLANDSRNARPSIFNDDDEFALLTNHDELLLRMLYDPRLSPGMTAAEAAPVIRIIARELTASTPL